MDGQRLVAVSTRALKVGVNIVGKDRHAIGESERGDHVELLRCPHPARRIVRVAPQEQVRVPHRLREAPLGDDDAPLRQVQGDPTQLAAGALDDLDDGAIRGIQGDNPGRASQLPGQDDRAQGRHALDDAREEMHVAYRGTPPVATRLPPPHGLAEVIEDLRVAEDARLARPRDCARHRGARRELHVRHGQGQSVLSEVGGQQVPLRAVRAPAND